MRVELYCPAGLGGGIELIPMLQCSDPAGTPDVLAYCVVQPGPRPASDYTVRIIPYHPAAVVPIEVDQIIWQR